MGKMIYGRLFKRLELDHADKWHMHKKESVQENELHKLLWDFEIQMNHPILVIKPDLVLINKKKRTCNWVDFAVPAGHRVKMK